MSFSARNAEGKSNGYNVRIVEKAVDKNAVFCSECGKRITENLAVQEEVVENVAVEAEEQAEKITARDNAEEVRKMNLFEKIEAYQQRGLEYTEDYRQLLKKGKKSLFFLEIKIFYIQRRVFIRDIYDGVIKAIL